MVVPGEAVSSMSFGQKVIRGGVVSPGGADIEIWQEWRIENMTYDKTFCEHVSSISELKNATFLLLEVLITKEVLWSIIP